MIRRVIILCLMAGLFLGCEDEQAEFKQRTNDTGQYMTEGDWKVQNEKALQMEADLLRRHRFFQALKGTYEGTLQTTEGNFKVRLTLIPSHAPYPHDSNRIRTIGEVEADLMNLSFFAQAIQWNPLNNLSAVGCQVKEIPIDMVKGEVSIAGEGCPGVYILRLSDDVTEIFSTSEGLLQEKEKAQELAYAVIEGKISTITQLRGQVQPNSNATTYEFLAAKVNP